MGVGGGGGGDGRGETSWANERVVEGFDGQVAGLWDKTRWYVRRWRHVAYRWFCGNGEQVLTLVQAWAPWRIRQAMFNAADAPVLWRVNGLQNVGGVARLTLHVSSGAPSTHPGEGYLKSSLPHYLTEKWGAREVGQDIFSVLHEKHTHPHLSEPLIFIVFHFFFCTNRNWTCSYFTLITPGGPVGCGSFCTSCQCIFKFVKRFSAKEFASNRET